MTSVLDRRTGFPQLFLAAVIGGLVVVLAGLVLIGTGFIDRPARSAGDGFASIAPVGSGKADRGSVGEIYDRASPAVGFITAAGAGGSPLGAPGQGDSTGSGFLIDRDGHMVTNDHVVAGSGEVNVRLGEQDFDAEVVGSDPSTDIALLRLSNPPSGTEPLELGDSAAVGVGDPVVAIGNPFGLDRTATTGIVSALQREIRSTNGYSISDVIQTDASINPGNSGGPLLDGNGRVIGVNSQIATGGGSNGSVGIGFAVPSSTVGKVVDELLEKGEVEHAWIGISGIDVEPGIASALELDGDVSGVLVQEVGPDGPADRAGIEPFQGDGAGEPGGRGDVIVAVDGKRSPTMAEIAALVNGSEPGDVIELTVLRDGRERTVDVELGRRPG
jgi:putative serine protease PepD